MTTVTMGNFGKNAKDYIAHAIATNDILHITTDQGNAVVLNEEEFRAMAETIRLMNAEGMRERIIEARETPIGESDDFAW